MGINLSSGDQYVSRCRDLPLAWARLIENTNLRDEANINSPASCIESANKDYRRGWLRYIVLRSEVYARYQQRWRYETSCSTIVPSQKGADLAFPSADLLKPNT